MPRPQSPSDFKHFCATRIQAAWKGYLTRRIYKLFRFSMYHVAAIQIQWAWRAYKNRLLTSRPLSMHDAAVKIQKAWRAYTNTKIFKYYKTLIQFRMKGDPRDLLRTINPNEASFIDRASNIHVRFRLGGENFPPLIYYKIYIHSGICDLNSFAPRDYTAIRKVTKKAIVNISLESNEVKKMDDGWYERYDNNGWRPITDNIIMPFDKVELQTASKPVTYHYDKQKRKELTAKQKRAKKLRWLRKLYSDAKKQEEEIIKETHEIDKDTTIDHLFTVSKEEAKESKTDDDNPFSNKQLLELNEDDFENQVNKLIEWSDTLDFDRYMNHWYSLATSAPTENNLSYYDTTKQEGV